MARAVLSCTTATARMDLSFTGEPVFAIGT